MRRVCVVITARPSYSRIRSALRAMQREPDLELQMVVAASALLARYGAVADQIEHDGFKISRRVHMVLEGETPITMAKTTGLGVVELSTAFNELEPDFVVTIADRYETIATAIAASYMNIPLVHIQGGEVTGSIDEKVRHAITKLADYHLVASEAAANRVRRLGEAPDSVIVTGCPSIDIAAEMLAEPALSFDPLQKYGGVGSPIRLDDGYLVVMQHPVTTEHERARAHVTETLSAIKELGLPTLWFWPNPDAGSDGTSSGIRAFRENERPSNIYFFKNMSPVDFLRLIYNCRCLVGNSSVGIREGSFLGVPVVNIGGRQDGRDRAPNVRDIAPHRSEIAKAIKEQLEHGRYPRSELYGDGHAGARIARAVADLEPRYTKRLCY